MTTNGQKKKVFFFYSIDGKITFRYSWDKSYLCWFWASSRRFSWAHRPWCRYQHSNKSFRPSAAWNSNLFSVSALGLPFLYFFHFSFLFRTFFSLLTAAESSLEMTFEIFSQFALEILRIDRVLHRIWTRTKGSETEEMVWRREESIVATKSLFFRICGIETWRDCAKRWIHVGRCEFFLMDSTGKLRALSDAVMRLCG